MEDAVRQELISMSRREILASIQSVVPVQARTMLLKALSGACKHHCFEHVVIRTDLAFSLVFWPN